ncbi:hypothetical protein HWV62_25759 [Athelia sp. TMB]|nr:hypothetical protein HWV62_25759 [Athelia sp. TMB]
MATLDDSNLIQQLFKSYETALNTSDMALTMSLYHPTDAVFMLPHSPPSIGRTAVQDAYEKLYALVDHMVSVTIEEVTVASPEWAFARTTTTGKYRVRASGKEEDDAVMQLWVLRKEGARWFVARYSFSPTGPAPDAEDFDSDLDLTDDQQHCYRRFTMSGRKLNPHELRLHQTALADAQKISNPESASQTVTAREAETLIPDGAARIAAINFLLGTGLLKAMKGPGDKITSYRAVTKKELEIKKDMTGEESMVLSHIQASGTEGIWTKHLKAKTELHQTVIDRCLKALTQKALIKPVKSHKHPTRKIYMLSHLQPSVEITGGPWYTDNELDTEFIKLLSGAVLHYIKDRSYPRQKATSSDSPHGQPLYPLGAAPAYPSAQQIQRFLEKSKITETELGVEHVEMLLGVLVLDGEIEKIPGFGVGMWDPKDESDASESDDSDADRKRKKKSKRRKTSEIDDASSDSDSDTARSRSHSRSSSKAKGKAKKRRKDELSETASSDGDDSGVEKRRKKRRKTDMDVDDASDADTKKKKRRKREPDTSETESPDDTRSARKAKTKVKVKRSRSASPVLPLAVDLDDDDFGGSYVYRAVRQERVALGWSQAPCGGCPVFEFCKDKGPVNPQECHYYGEWLTNGVVDVE